LERSGKETFGYDAPAFFSSKKRRRRRGRKKKWGAGFVKLVALGKKENVPDGKRV